MQKLAPRLLPTPIVKLHDLQPLLQNIAPPLSPFVQVVVDAGLHAHELLLPDITAIPAIAVSGSIRDVALPQTFTHTN